MKKLYVTSVILLLVFFSAAAPLSANAAMYVAGGFQGRFFYDNGNYADFNGVIYQDGARIWGDCVDEDGESSLTGSVDESSLTFVKTYRKNGLRVQYSGDIVPETNKVKGYWRIDQNNIGQFTMTIRNDKM